MKRDAVIVSAVRTPVGKYGGVLAPVKDYELGIEVIREAVKRADIPTEEIDDVYFGNLLGVPGNVAKVAAMGAGLPAHIPAVTIDRQCASGLESISIAAAMIKSGMGDIYIAGGCESMTNRPYYMEKQSKLFDARPPRFLENMFAPPTGFEQITMGQTAENIFEDYEFSREELDQCSYESHMKAVKAIKAGNFREQIIPLEVPQKKRAILVDTDEGPREHTNMEQLGRLKPLFKENGKVTAGNSCPMNDGAAALVVMSREKAEAGGCKILASITDSCAVGVDYRKMGLGPVYATRKLLEKTKIDKKEIGLVELNEAFAVQTLACLQELKFDKEIVNVNGGAIALGHPLAATGAVLSTKILYEMKKRSTRYGLVTMCIGGGQGMAMLFKNEEK
ncbi:MAG TPA: thiolase family protein [Lachnospiraceae bacterium]|nr:thiolase family protein [Lachnospiraceae bacterium]